MGFFSFLGIKKAMDTVEVGGQIVNKATDGIISGLDKIAYTPEEKDDNKIIMRDQIVKMWSTFATENTEQSKARRELANMTFKVFFTLLLGAAAVWYFNPTYAKFLFGLAKEIIWLVGMVGATYFVPHQLSKLKQFRG